MCINISNKLLVIGVRNMLCSLQTYSCANYDSAFVWYIRSESLVKCGFYQRHTYMYMYIHMYMYMYVVSVLRTYS